MYSFRRLALVLALSLPAFPALHAQSSSSSSSSAGQAADQVQLAQAEPQPAQETPQQLSVQERIRLRRQQRRATAIHDAYDHRFDTYVEMGYLRFKPGPNLQRLTFYAWDTGITRYYSERMGVDIDARGYFGYAYVGINQYSQGNLTRPQISQYDVMAGPSYRFYLQPKYSIAGRVMGGWSHGNFSGDTNGITPTLLGLYPDANTYAISGSILGEFNIAPNFALRVAPEYFATGYGSSMQDSLGFNLGFVYRIGKQ